MARAQLALLCDARRLRLWSCQLQQWRQPSKRRQRQQQLALLICHPPVAPVCPPLLSLLPLLPLLSLLPLSDQRAGLPPLLQVLLAAVLYRHKLQLREQEPPSILQQRQQSRRKFRPCWCRAAPSCQQSRGGGTRF